MSLHGRLVDAVTRAARARQAAALTAQFETMRREMSPTPAYKRGAPDRL